MAGASIRLCNMILARATIFSIILQPEGQGYCIIWFIIRLKTNFCQMKRTVIIIICIALVSLTLIARLLFKQNRRMSDEREWFVNALRYEFSAQIDSAWMFNPNAGRLKCLITVGDPQIHREDSLKRLFKQHDMLYLIFKRSTDSITFILPNHANLVARGDSVRMSSRENTIRFFRAGKNIVSDTLSESLTGFSRPFFMKQK